MGVPGTIIALGNRSLIVAVSSPSPGGCIFGIRLSRVNSVLSGCEVTQTHALNLLFYNLHANLPNYFAFGKTPCKSLVYPILIARKGGGFIVLSDKLKTFFPFPL